METTYIKSHLVNCIGYYQHVLLELESGLDFELQSCYGLIYDDGKKKSFLLDVEKHGEKSRFYILP